MVVAHPFGSSQQVAWTQVVPPEHGWPMSATGHSVSADAVAAKVTPDRTTRRTSQEWFMGATMSTHWATP
jgi:hypothetical protein